MIDCLMSDFYLVSCFSSGFIDQCVLCGVFSAIQSSEKHFYGRILFKIEK